MQQEYTVVDSAQARRLAYRLAHWPSHTPCRHLAWCKNNLRCIAEVLAVVSCAGLILETNWMKGCCGAELGVLRNPVLDAAACLGSLLLHKSRLAFTACTSSPENLYQSKQPTFC